MLKLGIKTKLIILVLITAIPVSLFNFYLLYQDLKRDKSSLKQSALHQSQMISDEIDQAIFESWQHLSTFAEIPVIKSARWQECSKFLSSLKSRYPYYENIFVADLNGWVRCSAVPFKETVNINDRSYFKEVIEKKQYTIGSVTIGRIVGKPVAILAFPVMDHANNITAVIGASLSLINVNAMFSHISLSPNTVILLIDQKGRIVSSNKEPEEYVMKDISNANWFQEILRKKEGILTLLFMGEERLTAVTAPRMVEWNSVVGIPTDIIYAPLKSYLIKSIFWGIMVLGLTFFIAIFIGRYISRPLSTLSKEIKEVGKGDFHRLVKIKTGDEIEELASSFNEMVKKLDERKVENEKLQKQLFLSQKMEAIGTLTGGIAHDFNNMLNVILGYTQLVIDETKKNTAQRRYIQQIQKAGYSAAELVQQLLAFSRRQVIDPKIININEAIYNLVKMLHRIIGENIALKLSLSENVLPVMADPGQMVQVIMNLCVNARDAMPQEGELTIETSNTIIDESYCQVHPWAHPGSYALLSITDTGIGMDSETQARIFEPFFTTKELGKGTGLGLAIVYGIIKQHNGLINVYSQKGHGTTFKIYLPSASGKIEALKTPEIAEVKGGKETILLAEDNDMLREFAETVLKDIGYTVIAAKNGDEAIQIFSANSDKIQLTVLDVIMPVCNGREAYDRMRAVKPDLKVIFVTGYSIATHHTESIAKEKLPLLQKPFTKESLARKVREALDKDKP
ncbi:MAG: response regulator [Nitrospirae bacterium]|nr:response regulator [Nitrospirota bacterium]